jgi:hypothetical protein
MSDDLIDRPALIAALEHLAEQKADHDEGEAWADGIAWAISLVEDAGRREPAEPMLGLATTGQLLDELRARIEVDFVSGRPGGLGYSTVAGVPPIERASS